MIKVVLIDDEKPALAKLRSLLAPYDDYEICGEYTDAYEALERMTAEPPQVAFIDIAMPGMNGMELANAIDSKLGRKIVIVFVTAHEEYALPAFDVWATDYLLKPVGRGRFEQTIKRLDTMLGGAETKDAPPPAQNRLMVHLFGKLEITRDEKPLTSWRTAKVRELFAFFLHNRNRSIYRDTLLETLWEGMSPNQALANLNTSNYYLRRCLENSGSDINLLYDSGYYSIDLGSAVCDVDVFEKVELKASALTDENLDEVLAGASLYRGRYFEDVKCSWADLGREHYASRYVLLRAAVAKFHLRHGKVNEALEQAMRGLEINRLSLDAWRVLLTAYQEKGDPTLMRKARENLYRAYRESSGSEPPVELLNIIKK